MEAWEIKTTNDNRMSQAAFSIYERYSTLVFRVFPSMLFTAAALKPIIIPAVVTKRLMPIGLIRMFKLQEQGYYTITL